MCWQLDKPCKAHRVQNTVLRVSGISLCSFSADLVPRFEENLGGEEQHEHRLTFLFAALHARQAVEFFFGFVTAGDVCGANVRGGPGANAGNCFALLWLIFMSTRSSSWMMISRSGSRLIESRWTAAKLFKMTTRVRLWKSPFSLQLRIGYRNKLILYGTCRRIYNSFMFHSSNLQHLKAPGGR